MRAAWVLNLDVERELEDGSFSDDCAIRFRKYFEMSGLLRDGDVVVAARTQLDESSEGRAWCPTPRALAMLERSGARVGPAPSVACLRRVNDRAFCFDLGDDFPGIFRVENDRALADALVFSAPRFVLKRPFGFAGKGRRLVGAALDDGDRAFVAATFARGHALIVEPWVLRVADFGLHAFVDEDGALTIGEPTLQELSANGQWLRTRSALTDELTADERNAFYSALDQTAVALRKAGYFGPFGIDAFRWVSASGQARFRARCEINARYSMGWATGMGRRRPPNA